MQAFLLFIHVVLALALIGLILIQHGKGADAGAAFGSGASSTVFGARGSGSFLTKITTFLAIAFFANSLALAYLSAHQTQDPSLIDTLQAQQAPASSQSEGTPPESIAAEQQATAAPANDAPADMPPVE